MSRFRYAWLWLGLIAGCAGWPGCGGHNENAKEPAQPFRGMKLVVGAVGDPVMLAAVMSQRGEWQATRGAELTVRESAVDPESAQGVDVFLFPGDRLGDLVDHQVLAVIPESAVQSPSSSPDASSEDRPDSPPADPLQFQDIIPAFRDQVSLYGKDRMGLPYGGSALVLIYRKLAFEDDANRAAAAKEKRALDLPKTWEQLDALAKFFQGRDWDGDGKADYGIALALGADKERLGTDAYLARAAALGQHRDQYSFLFDSDSMSPRIASPPFVEALQKTVALKAFGPPEMAKFDARAAREAFQEGNVAMLIDRAENAPAWSGGKAIGVAVLPGSERVYNPARQVEEDASPPNRPSYLPHGGGWLVGIARSSTGPRHEAALDFAKYLISPETSTLVRANRAFPMLPVRSSQVSQGVPDPQSAPGVEPRPWSEAVSRTLNAERIIPGLRIPHADDYLADLDSARASAAQGEPAKKVLEATAKAWSHRSQKLGKERQLWHYRRSLNSLVTTPEPPDR